MTIHYKYIEHERLEDAPFIGALISACDCKFKCKNCFNQHIKDLPVKTDNVKTIINEVKNNPFNKGIILAGLEWTLQLEEAKAIAIEAKNNGLFTMLFTGSENIQFDENLKYFDYVKIGSYNENLLIQNHIEYGVKLATSNQRIYKQGIDY